MGMTIPEKEKIIKVIEIFFPDATIYLFGSRARNEHNERSDIDIAFDAKKPVTMTEMGQIKSMIDALTIPQKIDIVDFNRVSRRLKILFCVMVSYGKTNI